jgi:hypothetical protein
VQLPPASDLSGGRWGGDCRRRTLTPVLLREGSGRLQWSGGISTAVRGKSAVVVAGDRSARSLQGRSGESLAEGCCAAGDNAFPMMRGVSGVSFVGVHASSPAWRGKCRAKGRHGGSSLRQGGGYFTGSSLGGSLMPASKI